MKALQFECQKIALKQDAAGFVLTLRIHPDDIPEELFRDFVGARYGCALVRIGDDEHPVPYLNRVQKAGILCRDRDFQFWAYNEFNSEGVTEQDAINAIYGFCGITSRSELNDDIEAQNLFDELLKKYEQYKESL
jgi:hypothetical protein